MGRLTTTSGRATSRPRSRLRRPRRGRYNRIVHRKREGGSRIDGFVDVDQDPTGLHRRSTRGQRRRWIIGNLRAGELELGLAEGDRSKDDGGRGRPLGAAKGNRETRSAIHTLPEIADVTRRRVWRRIVLA